MNIIIRTEVFNEEINSYLSEAFGEHHSITDEYNLCSEYIVIYCNDDIASLGRFSKCPNGIFFTWSNGSHNFSNTPDTLDLGRCLVTSKYRGGIFYDLLITYCLSFAFKSGYKYVNGAALVGKKMVDRLTIYGFSKVGTIIPILALNGKVYPIQAFVADLEKQKNIWESTLNDCLLKFETQGYKFLDQTNSKAI